MLFTDLTTTEHASRRGATSKSSRASSAGASTKSKGPKAPTKHAAQTKRASGLKSKPKTPSKAKRGQDQSKPAVRKETKQALLIEMLHRPNGATIAELVKAIGWQAHSIRGVMSGALKKKLGLGIESRKVQGRGRIYRIST
jgi:hypothetical protein